MVCKLNDNGDVVLALGDIEVASIINALRHAGNDDLACEIEEEVYGKCGGCDCDDGDWDCSTLANLTFDIDASALEAATGKLNALAEAAERAANAAERLEGALK